MSFAEQVRAARQKRAETIAAELAGPRVSRALVRACAALVDADEAPGRAAQEPKAPPVTGAREVLAVKASRGGRRAPGKDQMPLW